MAYDVNTSKTHRLPINFYWDFYENIPELEVHILELQEGVANGDIEAPQLPLLNNILACMKRQRMSHRGNEDL